MIWFLFLRTSFLGALARDLFVALVGTRCRVTGERVRVSARVDHEAVNHPGEGHCA